ncbi:MAG: hypothetical protein JW819_09970 [Candidatus Krumholzibacteriota bacterium]|nr:hypothetical protein [Candidatus Krumholzibacteriota bacterium]
MALFLKGRDLLSLTDLDSGVLDDLLRFASELKQRSRCGEELALLAGVQLYLYDPERILPAWDPFGLAVSRLGGAARRVGPEELKLVWGESFLDLFQQLDRLGDGLAMASIREDEGHGFIASAAGLMNRPVFNMLSEREAPFQTLATLLTLRERIGDDWPGKRYAIVWAPPGMSAKPVSPPLSLARALLGRGAELSLACPPDFRPGGEGAASAGRLRLLDDPDEAVDGADAVFSLNWGPVGARDDLERAGEAARDHAAWMMTAARLARAAPEALLGGGLPQSRDTEIEPALLDHPRSIHLDESENLLHAAKAVFALTLDLERAQPKDDDTTIQ